MTSSLEVYFWHSRQMIIARKVKVFCEGYFLALSVSMVNIKVKYFARLRELIGAREENYALMNSTELSDLLLKHIPVRHGEIAEQWKNEIFRTVNGEIALNKDGTPILRNYLVLVGGKSVPLGYNLKEGDEIAVLPPAGGG